MARKRRRSFGKYQRRHYEQTARELRASGASAATIAAWVERFKADNPAFRAYYFKAAIKGGRSDRSRAGRPFKPAKLAGYGAVAKHGGQFNRKSFARQIAVNVLVQRDIGASTAKQYRAQACVSQTSRAVSSRGRIRSKLTPRPDRRCGSGQGRTPTAASKAALRGLATKLR